MSKQDCPVHAMDAPDYDSRWSEGPAVPTLEDLTAELVAHLSGECGPYCDDCYDSYTIRRDSLGQEAINLEADHADKMVMAECTCGAWRDERGFLAEVRALAVAR